MSISFENRNRSCNQFNVVSLALCVRKELRDKRMQNALQGRIQKETCKSIIGFNRPTKKHSYCRFYTKQIKSFIIQLWVTNKDIILYWTEINKYFFKVFFYFGTELSAVVTLWWQMCTKLLWNYKKKIPYRLIHSYVCQQYCGQIE